jgi:hypothetical protein
MPNFFWKMVDPHPTQPDDEDSSGPHSIIVNEEALRSSSSQGEESFNSVLSDVSPPTPGLDATKMADGDTLKKILESLQKVETAVNKQNKDFDEFRTQERQKSSVTSRPTTSRSWQSKTRKPTLISKCRLRGLTCRS